MTNELDTGIRHFTGDDFMKALTPDHIIQLRQFIEDEHDNVLPDMLPHRDDPDFEQDFDHYMTLVNDRPTPAFPNRITYACVTVIYRWILSSASPRLDWIVYEAHVFAQQGDMEMFKFKNAVDTPGKNPIFN